MVLSRLLLPDIMRGYIVRGKKGHTISGAACGKVREKEREKGTQTKRKRERRSERKRKRENTG